MFRNKTSELLKFIKEKQKVTFIEIVRKFNIESKFNKQFSSFLNDLKKDGKLFFSKKNNFYYVPEFVGTFEVEYNVNSNNFGFAFISIDGKEFKVSITKNPLIIPLRKDLISLNVFKNIDYQDAFIGIINAIKQRKTNYVFCIVDESLNLHPIFFNQQINFKYDKLPLEPNIYAKFKIKNIFVDYIELELEQKIANIDSPYSDLDLMINFYNVNNQFDQEVITELENIETQVENKTQNNRKDLTNDLVVTIDGEKTKDFDDAINVKKTHNDTFILSVHIADVSYYVKEDSAIDKQALSRGTSIYLLDKVIPMLPEKLSNGICSLNPKVDRYVITFEAEIDKNGNNIYSKIYPSTINSKYRLTYNQVERYKEDELFKQDKELFNMIDDAFALSEILSRKKIKEGYIDFEIVEPIIEVDSNGKAINIINKNRLTSEILIENFMVYANEQVSEFISNLKIPSIYRIHEPPSEEKLDNLKMSIKALNLNNINVNKTKLEPRDFQKIVKDIKAQRFDDFVKILLLRTMQKAKYSSNNIGHFGLASHYYSHFTSPIRRYPDLLLHRIIRNVLFEKNHNYSINIKNKIEQISSISSQKEEEALVIERKINDIKKAEYYENKVNSIHKGVIVSLLSFAIFVELDDKVDVMIHISKKSLNKPLLLERNTILKIDDKEFKIGEEVVVKIIGVNKIEGKIDAELV